MSLPDDLRKVVMNLKKVITVTPETQEQIDEKKRLKESGTIDKRE